MDNQVKNWRADSKHYPPILRDFHDQKDLFKLIHRITNVEGHSYCKDVDWIKGQCYVIDIFLWTMARFGYTLQKSRTKLNFDNLEEFLHAHREEMNKQFAALFEHEENNKKGE